MPSEKTLLLAQEFSISYYYLTPEDSEKVQIFCKVSGDKESTLINQYVRGFIGRNRAYFLELAKFDATSRGLTSEQWVDIVLAEGMRGMPEYQNIVKTEDIPKNPLAYIPAPVESKVRRSLNYITLAAQNIAFLHLGIYYDRDSQAGYISRIAREHIDRNWDDLYLRQVEAAQSKVWF
ncbi:MAG: transposase [Nostoc sp. NMS2]|uniref:transposase n=1 Tax=Nostoc sp. NMS2 TaxID=2815389 RepID=UPI0025CF83AF|nr:transposase [Nostoc sp. NMS2]MBN3993850.1 transposase [Nostoc sp. NMS2]